MKIILLNGLNRCESIFWYVALGIGFLLWLCSLFLTATIYLGVLGVLFVMSLWVFPRNYEVEQAIIVVLKEELIKKSLKKDGWMKVENITTEVLELLKEKKLHFFTIMSSLRQLEKMNVIYKIHLFEENSVGKKPDVFYKLNKDSVYETAEIKNLLKEQRGVIFT
ncbi:MAG: hypothetical protein ABFQ53_02535 [Patescibacteria group bacterium]